MSELPTGTVTFLFTDLEGSTRLWEEHPEAMKQGLARHDAILRDAVVAREGHVVKTTGDGLHAVFSTAPNAVAAAVAAQRQLVGEVWPLPKPLRVRMGLHTGHAELRDGDYYGPAVNRAARIAGAAHGGQIVVSLATEELVREALPVAVGLVDLGEHRLRDVGQPERIFQIKHAQLGAVFPPLRSLTTFPGELPVVLTSFVGRERDVESVVGALGESRIVTVIGAGGIGKTRLALQAAADALAGYPDGAWFCELARVIDRVAVAEAVAGCLGIRLQPGESPRAALLGFLRYKRLLLVLDNCEHLLDAVGSLAEAIVHACAGVTVLATSREALAVDGERLWPLRSLPVPDHRATVEEAALLPAVRLFTERARTVRPDFTLDASNALVVGDICRQLDGMPLAIELAAARVGALSVAQIAARLDQRFRLLTGGRRTALERHQTLRGAIDWSYDLLDEAGARLFGRLAVFAGGFTLEAAEAVVIDDGIEADDVLDLLSGLVARSMLEADEAEGATRYRLHETMRQYARERLDTTGEAGSVRRRHAEYYTALAELAAEGLNGRDEERWAETIDEELSNFAVALDWSVTARDAELALRLANALVARPRAVWGRMIEPAFDLPEARTNPLRATAMARATIMTLVLSGSAASLSNWVRATDAAFEAAGLALTAEARFAHAVLGSVTGHIDQVREYGDSAIEMALDGGDRHLATFQCALLAIFLTVARDHDAAIRRADQAHDLAWQLGNPSLNAVAEMSLGFALSPIDPDAAIAHLRTALAMSNFATTEMVYDVGGRCLARLLATRGDFIPALKTYADCLDRAMDIGARIGITLACDSLAVDLVTAGRTELAATLLGALEVPMADYRGNSLIARDAARDTLQHTMGKQRFEECTARGRVMDIEDLAVYTRAQIQQMLAETRDR